VTDWITPELILERAGNVNPSAEDSTWAEVCAAAVNAGIDKRLEGSTWVNPLIEPPPPPPPELLFCASVAGVESYKRREATFGLTGYVDLQGAAIRVARDYLEAQAPIIARYATLGIA
jgi:hypothetical protein